MEIAMAVDSEDWVEAPRVPVGMMVRCLAALAAKVHVAMALAEVWEAAKVEVVARAAVTALVLALEVASEVVLAVAPEPLEETTAVGSPAASNK